MNTFEQKVAIVTRGASRIGSTTAHLFVREDAFVVVSDIDQQRGEEKVDNIAVMAGTRPKLPNYISIPAYNFR